MNNDRSTVNTIYCGECSEVMRKHILDDSIDLTVTSPPYDNLRDYQGYVFDFEAIAQQLWRVTKPGGIVVWVVGDATINGSETLASFKQALYFRELGFNVHDTMIYRNVGTRPQKPIVRYGPCFDYMFILSKGRPTTLNIRTFPKTGEMRSKTKMQKNGKMISGTYNFGGGALPNIWEYAPSNEDFAGIHPGIFPEALARDHIISWSNPGDIVFDPFCGSGTTLKIAKEQGRQYIGIDISQEYCELSQRRVDGARVPLPGILLDAIHTEDEQLSFMEELE